MIINKSIIDAKNIKEVEKGSQKRYYPTSKFIIEGCNYGSWELVPFDISGNWEVEGCIGADFFLEHAIYLDFHNNIAYIRKPESFAISTQWKRIKLRATQLYRKMVHI